MNGNAYTQRVYWDMLARAEYYAWAALRGHSLAGCDPITGFERSKYRAWHPQHEQGRGECRAAYIAMAKYWLTQAGELRRQA